MEIVETSVFHKQVSQLFDPMDYTQFLVYLFFYPRAGSPIIEGRGIRKIRWKKKGSGKRGGIRVIYVVKSDKIYLLYGYSKAEKDNLGKKQIKQLAKIAKNL
nr:MAG TPA: Toxin HigB-2, Nanobody 6-antitoxin system, toxin [Caudoviricetes sp.]